MRLGGEVDDDLGPVLAQRRLGELAVADVSLDEDDPVLDAARLSRFPAYVSRS